jgi:Wax ester synthase/diacylglycerol acyltransferase catalytic domain
MPVERLSALDASFQTAESTTAHIASLPLGVRDPVWVDDPRFDLDRHVFDAGPSELSGVVDQAMSSPIDRSRPLWELWIAPRLSDGRIGVVGKAHHCMVDGLAAVQLAVVPLAERHALSIGFSTVSDRACFRLYADRRSLPDVDMLARELGREIDQLLLRASAERRPATALRSRRPLATAP